MKASISYNFHPLCGGIRGPRNWAGGAAVSRQRQIERGRTKIDQGAGLFPAYGHLTRRVQTAFLLTNRQLPRFQPRVNLTRCRSELNVHFPIRSLATATLTVL